MIIDKNNPDHKHIPHTLDGEVLLEETKDTAGNTTGFLTIEPGYLKYYAETKTNAELKELGFEKFMDKIADIKGRAVIVAKIPPVPNPTIEERLEALEKGRP